MRFFLQLALLGLVSLASGFVLPPPAAPSALGPNKPSQSQLKHLPARQGLAPLQVFGNLFAPAVSSASKKAESAAKAQELKQAILRLSANKDNGVKATPAEREEVLRLAKELAKLNQVKAIARSTATDGLWRLVFTTTSGSSSGKLGPFVGEVLQDIDSSSKTYVNIVRLLGGVVEGNLVAKWEVLGANDWKVIFDTITFKVLGVPVVDKKPLNGQAGVWRLTYADEDLRVLFAAGMTNQGKPARTENIYILKRA